MVEFFVQSLQLGILNVIEAMNFAPEIVYPLYLSAASDRYSISEFCLKYTGIFMWIDNDANHCFNVVKESVSKKGEELLKRKASTVNLEDPNLIKKLFTVFSGMHFLFLGSRSM